MVWRASSGLKICLVGVAVLVAGRLPAAGQAVTGEGKPVKVAVIDVRRIIVESNPGKETLEQLEKLQREKQEELKGKQDEINELRRRIADGRLSLTDERLAQLQKELEDKVIAFRRAEDDAARELNSRRNELLQRIEDRVLPIIGQTGEEFGYTLIFNKFDSGLVFADESVDITDLIIQRFNAASSGN